METDYNQLYLAQINVITVDLWYMDFVNNKIIRFATIYHNNVYGNISIWVADASKATRKTTEPGVHCFQFLKSFDKGRDAGTEFADNMILTTESTSDWIMALDIIGLDII